MTQASPSSRVRAAVIGAALAPLVIATAPVLAQDRLCGDRQTIFAQLAKDFGESPAGAGTAANGGVVELLTGENGSWTLVLSLPNGGTCLIATGDNWEPRDSRPRVVAEKAV